MALKLLLMKIPKLENFEIYWVKDKWWWIIGLP